MDKVKRIVQLDGLRFFAVLSVMIAHWVQWTWSDPFLKRFPFNHGVTLFFVLSGFLITNILLKYKQIYLRDNLPFKTLINQFYARRFLRIFPIYYLLLFVLFALNYDGIKEVFAYLVTYTTNIYISFKNINIRHFHHFWSLAVEEQFYLFWPFVILFTKNKNTYKAIIITIAIAFISRFYFFFFVDKWIATTSFTLSCMHSLGLGALLAYFQTYGKIFPRQFLRPIWIYIGGIMYLISIWFFFKHNTEWYLQIFEEFTFALLMTLIVHRASKNDFKGILKFLLENRFVTYSGKISYGLYLFHPFAPSLMYYINDYLHLQLDNQFIWFTYLYMLTFLIAHFSWALIERPINSLKNNFPYSKI